MLEILPTHYTQNYARITGTNLHRIAFCTKVSPILLLLVTAFVLFNVLLYTLLYLYYSQ